MSTTSTWLCPACDNKTFPHAEFARHLKKVHGIAETKGLREFSMHMRHTGGSTLVYNWTIGGLAIQQTVRSQSEAVVRATHHRAGKGWAAPRSMGADRSHYFKSGKTCLCGRWKEYELLNEREDRRPIIRVDAPSCVEIWRKLFEPAQKVFEWR